MDNTIDVIIPTCRTRSGVEPLIQEIERTAGCPVRVIATCRPVCAAKNRNIGLDLSESDPVFMVDDDCSKFPQGWVKQMAEAIISRPRCVMLSARLMKPNGDYGFMMGCNARGDSGIFVSPERKLPTACVAIRRLPIRFWEELQGSGFEDNAWCYDAWEAYPDSEWCVLLSVKVCHANEMKQQARFWEYNKALILKKYGRIR